MDDFIRPKKRSPLHGVGDNKHSKISSMPLPLDDDRQDDIIPEPAFIPPEELADNEILEAAKYGDPVNNNADEQISEPKKGRRINIHMPHGKKQWIIMIIILVLVLSVGSTAGYWFLIRKPVKPAVVALKPKAEKVIPVPTTESSKLSGLEVPIGTNLKPVTSVMIENSLEARPQAGLKEASIIFEAISEGGITRFNALFQDTAPEYVGPIRSVRPYYLDWLWPFDASIAHVGGAPQALIDIKTLGIKDLDQFANSRAYDRIKGRYAPHNVYTSIARLNELEKSKGYTSATFEGFLRKKEAKSVTPNAKTINLAISSFYFNVRYEYDTATNSYLRSEGGEKHKDDKSGTQLSPKVVIAIVMGRGIAPDGQHTDYETTGTGQMFVYQDGIALEGTWSKETRQAQWKFSDAAGKPLALNAGQTWITMVDSNSSVSVTP